MSSWQKKLANALTWVLFLAKWGGAAVFLFGLWWRMSYVLDPPEPLRISEELTIITEPLTDLGLPDYGAYHLARLREGVDLENNSAVSFWRAMGVDEIDPEYRDAFFHELGVPVPDNSQAMEPLLEGGTRDRLTEWLEMIQQPALESPVLKRQAELLVRMSARRLPMHQQPPALRDWLNTNAESLKLLKQSADNPIYYSPPPNLLVSRPLLTISWLVPDYFVSRDAALALAIQSADFVAKHRSTEAIANAVAILTMSDRTRSQRLSLAELVANSLESTANEVLILCVDNATKESDLEGIVQALGSRGHSRWVSEAFLTTDSVDAAIQGHAGLLSTEGDGIEACLYRYNDFYEINDLLAYIQRWRNEAIAIASIQEPSQRHKRAQEYDEAWQSEVIEASESRIRTFEMLFSRKLVAESWAMSVGAELFPSMGALIDAEDAGIARHRLTLLTAAIKLHQLRDGTYPESLDELSPQTLASVPTDPFTNKSFHYERRADGFLIYSLGGNGRDDGGSDRSGDFVDGEHAPVDWFGEREPVEGPDDIVVRLPIPKLELPRVAPWG